MGWFGGIHPAQVGAGRVLRRAFLSLWRVGWGPLDVAHVGARQLPKELRSLLPVALELDLVAQRSRLSDRFVSQADALGFALDQAEQLDGPNKRSFLLSFAQRIRERPSEGTGAARVDAEATFGGAPVMASRAEAVDGLRSTLFPVTINRETSISNAAGYNAGWRPTGLATR